MWLTHSVRYNQLADFLVVLDFWHSDGGFVPVRERDRLSHAHELVVPPRAEVDSTAAVFVVPEIFVVTGVVKNAPMVAIIKCTEDEQEHLTWRDKLHNPRHQDEWVWNTTRPRKHWHKGSHLTLIVTGSHRGEPVISRLGWTKRVRQGDDLGEKLEISRIRSTERPVPLSELMGKLPQKFHRHLVSEGQQSDGTGKALVDALLGLRPDLRHVVDHVRGQGDRYPVGESRAAQVLALQRDATIGVSRMAGMDIPDFALWDPPVQRLDDDEVPPTFTSTLPTSPALEDHLINHDAESMMGWLSDQTRHVSWRIFRQYGQQLLVANANRTTAERTLGVDIIYYSVTRESLILVQYKKLDAERKGFYYPNSDAHLDKELARMRAVDRLAERQRRPGDDFRILPSPSWLKLCHPQAFIPKTNDMIHGMYLAREHFEQLRKDSRLKTERGAVRFGFENVPSYLDNTMFIKLVENGLIGTAGTSTELVRQQIIRSFEGRKATVLATLAGPETPQSARNSMRRRG